MWGALCDERSYRFPLVAFNSTPGCGHVGAWTADLTLVAACSHICHVATLDTVARNLDPGRRALRMTRAIFTRWLSALGPAGAAILLVGCAALRTAPVSGSPARSRSGAASCAHLIARAHAALAVPGDSAVAIAAGHAAYAAAIHEYHTCLASNSAP